MARPTKLTPEMQAQLLTHVRAGVPPRIAAKALGLCAKTMDNWLQRGRAEDDGEFNEFAFAVDQAAAQASVGLIATIRRSAKTSTRDAKWLLERMDPEQWERKRVPEIVEVEFSPMEKAAKIRAAMREIHNATVVDPPADQQSAAG